MPAIPSASHLSSSSIPAKIIVFSVSSSLRFLFGSGSCSELEFEGINTVTMPGWQVTNRNANGKKMP
jgi:hypothetical protein